MVRNDGPQFRTQSKCSFVGRLHCCSGVRPSASAAWILLAPAIGDANASGAYRDPRELEKKELKEPINGVQIDHCRVLRKMSTTATPTSIPVQGAAVRSPRFLTFRLIRCQWRWRAAGDPEFSLFFAKIFFLPFEAVVRSVASCRRLESFSLKKHSNLYFSRTPLDVLDCELRQISFLLSKICSFIYMCDDSFFCLK